MNLASLKNLALTRRSGRLLVVETDGFALRAVIVRVAKGAATVERLSQSKLIDPQAALADALEGLRGAKLPKKAVLVSAEVTSAMLRLPIDPKSPRPASEMQELIRWELEPHVAVHTGARPIGEILFGRGHLTSAQVREILEEQNDRKVAAAGVAGKRTERFGEIAVSLSLVTRGQIEDALEIQRRFQMPADDLSCGWVPLEQSQSDEAGQWKWLACGIGRAARDRWTEAFAAHNLDLSAIYPLVGTTVAALDDDDATGATAVLELQYGLIGTSRLRGGQLDTWQWHLTAGHDPSSELCHDLLGHDSLDRVWIAGRHPALESIATQLSSRLSTPVRPLSSTKDALPLPPDVAAESLAGCLAAARHATGATASNLAVSLAAQDPGPPAWQRPQVWTTAVAATLLLALVGTELYLRSAIAKATVARDDASTKLMKVEGEVARLAGEAAHVESLKKQLAAREAEQHTWNRLRTFLEDDLERRNRFLPALFSALAGTVSEEIAIDRISESSTGEIKISFWSLSNKAAEEFAQTLHHHLGAWQLAVTTRSMQAQEGRLGLAGYAFDVQLKPAVTTPSATVSSSATAEQR